MEIRTKHLRASFEWASPVQASIGHDNLDLFVQACNRGKLAQRAASGGFKSMNIISMKES